METGAKIGLGIAGGLAAIAVIYFGFTDKGKSKWASLTGSSGTDASGNSIPRKKIAEDAATDVKLGADGDTLVRRRPGFGSAFGGSMLDANGSGIVRGAGAEFTGVSSKTKKDGPNRKIEELKKQGLVTF